MSLNRQIDSNYPLSLMIYWSVDAYISPQQGPQVRNNLAFVLLQHRGTGLFMSMKRAVRAETFVPTSTTKGWPHFVDATKMKCEADFILVHFAAVWADHL